MKTNKICVIICEYNPFHNGHKLLIQKARELSQCEYIACIMSGDFSQRGEPCVLNKYSRAELAIVGGADIVLHLPTAYSCSSAEVFAHGGVKIANCLKNATHICFGSECGEIEPLKKLAEILVKEPKPYKKLLKKHLSKGLSYPASRQKAIEELVNDGVLDKGLDELLKGSNNILAIEYLKALITTKSKLTPITVKRQGEDFNSKKQGEFASASSLRDALYSKGIKAIDQSVPKEVYAVMKQKFEKQPLPDKRLFDTLRLFTLRTSSLDYLRTIFDVKEGLENRLHHISRECGNYESFINLCKTKRYTESRLNRVALASMLGIDKITTHFAYKKITPYIKVLAVKRNKILSNLECSAPLIIRNSNIPLILKPFAKRLLEIEDRADTTYALITGKVSTLPYLYNQALVLNI